MTVIARKPVTNIHDPLLASASNEALNSSLLGQDGATPQKRIESAKAKLHKLDITRRDILKFEVVNGEVLISTKAGCKVLVRSRELDKKTEESDVVVFSDGEVVNTEELLNELPPPQPSSPPSTQDLKEFNVCRALKESSSSLAVPSPVTGSAGLSTVGKVGLVAGTVGAVGIAESSRKSDNTPPPSKAAFESILKFAKENTFSQPTTAGSFSYVGNPPQKIIYETAGVTGITDKNIAAINDALATLTVTDESINTLAKLQDLVNVISAIIASTKSQLNASENLNVNSLLLLGLKSVDENNLNGIRKSISAQADGTNLDTVGELQALIDFYNAVAPTLALKVNNSTAITNDASIVVSNTTSGTKLLYSVDDGGFTDTYTPPTTQGQHTVSVRQINQQGYLGQITTKSFTYDTIAPSNIDLSTFVAGEQSSATLYVRRGGIQPPPPTPGGFPSLLLPNIAKATDTDIARITFTATGAIDRLDSLIAPNAGIVKPFDDRNVFAPNQNFAEVSGIDWRYDGTNKSFSFSKNDGSYFSGAEVQTIEKSLKFITSSLLNTDRSFSLSHIDAAGNVTSVDVIIKIDNDRPTIDLIAGNPIPNDNAQASYFNATHAITGKTVAPNMATPLGDDISAITVVMAGSGADPTHDTLVFDSQEIAIDASATGGDNLTIGPVTGISWSYIDKTLTFTKTNTSEMSATEVQSIETALRFQINSGADQGDRTFTFTHIDHAGNRSDVATVTFTVDTLAPTPTLSSTGTGPVATSSELGTAYLVNKAFAVTTLSDILGAADDLWNATTINATNTDITLNRAGLSSGNYVLYTTDKAGNLSDSTTNFVVL